MTADSRVSRSDDCESVVGPMIHRWFSKRDVVIPQTLRVKPDQTTIHEKNDRSNMFSSKLLKKTPTMATRAIAISKVAAPAPRGVAQRHLSTSGVIAVEKLRNAIEAYRREKWVPNDESSITWLLHVSSMSFLANDSPFRSIPSTNKRHTVTSTNYHPDARRTCSPLPTRTRMAESLSRASKRSFVISEPLTACLAPRLRQFSVRRENPTPKSSSVVSWNLFGFFVLRI